MKDGFLKAAAFSPALRVADCTYNAQQVLAQLLLQPQLELLVQPQSLPLQLLQLLKKQVLLRPLQPTQQNRLRVRQTD
jgi:hypothetical protein